MFNINLETMKRNILIPFFAIVFAMVAAFATVTDTSDAFDIIDGYIDAENCEQPVQCSTLGTEECTYLGLQVYGKESPFDTSCQRIVYKP